MGAGDFLSLLGRGSAPGEGRPAPAGNLDLQDPRLRLEGTTVFAFHCAAGALVAGDRRATAGNVVFSDRTEKVLPIDRHCVLAIAGSPAIAFEMARVLQTSFEFYRRSQLQPMSLPAKLRALSRLLRENLPITLQGVGLVAPLFVGAEPGQAPVIHFYDPLGAEFAAAEHAASGSGSGSIRAVLHFLSHWGQPAPADLPLVEAIRLALRLLLTSAEFDTASGGIDPARERWATLQLVTPDGVRPITADEQRSAWEAGS